MEARNFTMLQYTLLSYPHWECDNYKLPQETFSALHFVEERIMFTDRSVTGQLYNNRNVRVILHAAAPVIFLPFCAFSCNLSSVKNVTPLYRLRMLQNRIELSIQLGCWYFLEPQTCTNLSQTKDRWVRLTWALSATGGWSGGQKIHEHVILWVNNASMRHIPSFLVLLSPQWGEPLQLWKIVIWKNTHLYAHYCI